VINNNFLVFIITHKRANSVLTFTALREQGYSGDICLIVDDTDNQIVEYKQKFNNVVVFNKQEYIDKVDTLCYPKNPNSAVYARAFVEDYARSLNLKSFMLIDDDITRFNFRYNDNGLLRSMKVSNLDDVINIYNNYLLECNLSTISFGGGASYIGGISCLDNNMKRRCFQCYLRNVSIPLTWVSNMNEDYISTVREGKLGKLLFELLDVGIVAKETMTGNQSGGMQEFYKQVDTFKRSFFSVISDPSSFSVQNKKDKFIIRCKWNNAVPKIVSSFYKKR